MLVKHTNPLVLNVNGLEGKYLGHTCTILTSNGQYYAQICLELSGLVWQLTGEGEK